jgi:thymidine kinase
MRDTLTYTGKINLIIGCMWSEKTSELVRRYKRHTLGGRKCIMIKYKNDTRYDNQMVVTHDGIKVTAFVCEYLSDANEIIKTYDVICVDEVQFYKDAHIFIDKWANEGKIIDACGLNGTFNRTEFPIISKLIPLAETITHLKAVCKETGKDAIYSKMKVDGDKNVIEVIGGSDKYDAVDRKTYFNDRDFYTFDRIKEYFEIYANIHGIILNYDIIDQSITDFIEQNENMSQVDLPEMADTFFNI